MTVALPCFTVLSIGCIACAFTGIGAKNATLALPEYAGYQETGLFVSDSLNDTAPDVEGGQYRLTTKCGKPVVLHIRGLLLRQHHSRQVVHQSGAHSDC
jgi:hypothetical protein